MNLEKKRRTIIYEISLIIFLAYYILIVNSTFKIFLPKLLIRVIQLTSYLGFALLIITDRNNIKKWCMKCILLVIGITINYFTREIKIFELILLVLASQNIEFEKIAKIAFYEIIILIAIVIISALLKIIPNYVFYRENDGVYRYALGFVYVSQLPTLLLELIFLRIYLNEIKNKDSNFWEYFVYLFMLFIVYKITNLRNLLMVGIIFIIISIFIKKLKWVKINNSVGTIFKYIFLICFIFSFILTKNYTIYSKEYQKLDKILTGRLRISNELINSYDVKLFGNKIEMYGSSSIKYGGINSEDYFYIDSLYLQLLYRDGIIISIIFLIMYYYVMKKCIERNDEIGIIFAIWFFIVAVYSLIGDNFLSVAFNIPILAIYTIKNKKEMKQDKKNEEKFNS